MTTDRLSLVRRLTDVLRAAKGFEKLEKPQQAALRAQVTRLKSQITDPELLKALEKAAELIGEPETRETRTMTVESLTEELDTYAEKDPGQRRAFKAKVKKFIGLNEDPGIKARATEILNKIEAVKLREAEADLAKVKAEIDSILGGDEA